LTLLNPLSKSDGKINKMVVQQKKYFVNYIW
jgi:hypothetical protein